MADDIPMFENHHQDQEDLQTTTVQGETQAQPSTPHPIVPDDLVNPLGWNFKPRHESNVKILRKKIAGYPVNLDKTIVIQGDFYSQPPEQLLANQPYSYENKYLVMVDRKFKDKGKARFNRQLPASTPGPGGSWAPKGNVTSVLDSATGHRIGTRSAYRFYSGTLRAGNKAPSSWKMVEYLSTAPIASNLALCCVYKSENKREKLARKTQKKRDKSVYVAKVKEDTTKLRAEKAARAAEKAKAGYLYEKVRLKFRRFKASGGGAGSLNDVDDASLLSASTSTSASGLQAAAAGDAAQEMLASDEVQPDNGADEDLENLDGVAHVRYGEHGGISVQLG